MTQPRRHADKADRPKRRSSPIEERPKRRGSAPLSAPVPASSVDAMSPCLPSSPLEEEATSDLIYGRHPVLAAQIGRAHV